MESVNDESTIMHIMKLFLPGIEETRGTAAPAFDFCGICGVPTSLFQKELPSDQQAAETSLETGFGV